VTNLDLTPWKAHKFYGKRATSENWLEWCKNQMAAGSILSQDFWANSAMYQTCILACNLLVWMMWLTTRKGWREEPNTIRAWRIKAPARLITSGPRLRLPAAWPRRCDLLRSPKGSWIPVLPERWRPGPG